MKITAMLIFTLASACGTIGSESSGGHMDGGTGSSGTGGTVGGGGGTSNTDAGQPVNLCGGVAIVDGTYCVQVDCGKRLQNIVEEDLPTGNLEPFAGFTDANFANERGMSCPPEQLVEVFRPHLPATTVDIVDQLRQVNGNPAVVGVRTLLQFSVQFTSRLPLDVNLLELQDQTTGGRPGQVAFVRKGSDGTFSGGLVPVDWTFSEGNQFLVRYAPSTR